MKLRITTKFNLKNFFKHYFGQKICFFVAGGLGVFALGLVIGLSFGEIEDKSEVTNNTSATSLPSLKENFSRTASIAIEKSQKDKIAHENYEFRKQKEYNANPKFKPKWLNDAVVFSIEPKRPLIAIVLDDMGVDQHTSNWAVNLKGPLTLSYLSYADRLPEQTKKASANGHELLVHLPMEPLGNQNPGPGALLTNMDETQLQERLSYALSRFSGFVGVNNHMGSLFTSNRDSMEFLLSRLKKERKLFLDSVTTPRSLAREVGKTLNMSVVLRDVFLDDTNTKSEVLLRLLEAERIATITGTAIAIGHPRPVTLNVLEDWLLSLSKKNIDLAPLSAVARLRLRIDQ